MTDPADEYAREYEATEPHGDVCWQHPIDVIEPEEEEHAPLDVKDIGTIPVGALKVFIMFLLPPKGGALRWKTAAARLAALAHACGVEAHLPLKALAEEIGVSRALLSLHAVELRAWAGVGLHGGKSDKARQVYADRAKAVWQARGARERQSRTEHVASDPRPSTGAGNGKPATHPHPGKESPLTES